MEYQKNFINGELIEKILKKLIELSLVNGPISFQCALKKVFCPLGISKKLAIRILKVLKKRGLIYFSVYGNILVVCFSRESLNFYLKRSAQLELFDFSTLSEIKNEMSGEKIDEKLEK